MRSVQFDPGKRLSVVTSPEPLVRPGHVLIQNAFSLISAGTERMVLNEGKRPLSRRGRPRELRRWLEEVRDEGLFETVRQVRARLDEPLPLGYSSAGTVLACGVGVQDFRPGDRLATNGPHAEVVCVPRHLCAKVPTTVSFEHAAFTTLGAVALQGVRLSRLVLGETALVVGLGLTGLLAVALLRSTGCRVIGVDPDAHRCRLAEGLGAVTARPGLAADTVEELTGGLGVDAVLIASSTYSSAPLQLAARAVRRKGRIVLVGVVGMQLERQPFYFKEAEFVVSCSYGPGRYDPRYEELGHDYPFAYVRWTEQRNMQAVLDLMASGGLDVEPLVTHRFEIAQAGAAYELIEGRRESYLGILLVYPSAPAEISPHRVQLSSPTAGKRAASRRIPVGIVGRPDLAWNRLLPAIVRRRELAASTICSADGVAAARNARHHGFEVATSDAAEIFRDSSLRAVFIFSPPAEHADHVLGAIHAGQHVFVHKPLCRHLAELGDIERALADCGDRAPQVMVGFNRRFAPATLQVAELFAEVEEPLAITVRVVAGKGTEENAGTGAQRLLGEACQAVDLATYLAGALPKRIYAESPAISGIPSGEERCFITMRHQNGTVTSVVFLTDARRERPRERVEVVGGGRLAVIEDFRRVTLSVEGERERRRRVRGRGFQQAIDAWVRALAAGEPSPIAWPEIAAVTRATILAARSLREGVPFDL